MRLLVRLTAAVLLAAAPALGGAAAADVPEPVPAPLFASAAAVPGKYIVSLDEGVDADGLAERLGLEPTFVYGSAMNGFAVPLTPGQLDDVRATPGVRSVEADAEVSAPPTPAGPAAPSAARAPAPTWGLDRIDQRTLPLDGDFTTGGDGAGVTAYILDTGIDYAHPEFEGRAEPGFDAVGDGAGGQDCEGHGTHVAGTVGGRTYGVARAVRLVSVRVLGCDGRGEYSAVVAGLDWVAANATQPAVLNVSLGGGRSDAVNRAATAVAEAGTLPVVAAGNSAADACTVSPASADRVLTVAASNRWDEQSAFSNRGGCVEIHAPGEQIDSALLGGDTVALNGTSMAAPHVTGTAALYKAAHPAATPEEVAGRLLETSTEDLLTGTGADTPNRLLFTDGI
ncbi:MULTISPECIES: S8 family peptidase [Streptomyces]|uniref:Peptidase S8 n=1 Tax=Streptomyces amritsarensis TaxID=681158 RepID=A0ABX3FUV7_9ACTN|nr:MULTISPECIES: S8 family peptidase [Streptomyces]AQT75993.1 peptidase S8 [Streptomyces sp. fd1-xmd]OLZ54304.1 peptidase S8 [Streptomyces amritsarensis]